MEAISQSMASALAKQQGAKEGGTQAAGILISTALLSTLLAAASGAQCLTATERGKHF